MSRLLLISLLTVLGNPACTFAQGVRPEHLHDMKTLAASEFNAIYHPGEAGGFDSSDISLERIEIGGLGSLQLYRASFLGTTMRPIVIGYDGNHLYPLGGTKNPNLLEAFNAQDLSLADEQRWLWLAVMADPNGARGVLIPCRANGLLVDPAVEMKLDDRNCSGNEQSVVYQRGKATHLSIEVRSAVFGYYSHWDPWTLTVELSDKGVLVNWSITDW